MTAIKEEEATSTGALLPQARENTRGVRQGLASIALLTGGDDKPYVVGLTEALTANGISMDLIGSNDLLCDQLLNNRQVKFLNLRGDQSYAASFTKKVLRISIYYIRLMRYVATARPKILHIQWNNKFQAFDRTLLMLYYKLLGKKIVFTAHNVNAGKRDGNDSFLNRLTLRIQYALSDHIFVHTKAMKAELQSDFSVPDQKVSVIPFGINNTVPNTELTADNARRELGLDNSHRVILFFGRIVPYKGLEYLIEALGKLGNKHPDLRLVIAGATNKGGDYWQQIQETINRTGMDAQIIQRIQFIPDEETEFFFKAADVLVLPYTNIFQTGLLFLGYSFGLPAIVTDVGSLREDIIEGKTGFVSATQDPAALANTIERYFSSELYQNLDGRRRQIQAYANERYSWSKVAAITTDIYSKLLEK